VKEENRLKTEWKLKETKEQTIKECSDLDEK
jgi:hypothetical protein